MYSMLNNKQQTMKKNPKNEHCFSAIRSKSIGRKVQAAVMMPDGTVSCRKGIITMINLDNTVTLSNGWSAHFGDLIFLD